MMLDIGTEARTSCPPWPGQNQRPQGTGRRDVFTCRTGRTTLPLGISDFATLRRCGYYYADRTGQIAAFLNGGSCRKALARPPHFGKTLTISTIDAMLSGCRELFKGLAAEEFVATAPFIPMPVLRFDFGRIRIPEGAGKREVMDAFHDGVMLQLRENAARHDIDLERKDTLYAVRELVRRVRAMAGRNIAILIDNFDGPLIESYVKGGLRFHADSVREWLRQVLSLLTGRDTPDIAVAFGVNRFAAVQAIGLGPKLLDASMFGDSAEIMGITERDWRSLTSALLEAGARGAPLPDFATMVAHCGLHSFDGETGVASPDAVLRYADALMGTGKAAPLPPRPSKLVDACIGDYSFFPEFPSRLAGLRLSWWFAHFPGATMAMYPPQTYLLLAGWLTMRLDAGEYLLRPDCILEWAGETYRDAVVGMMGRTA